MYIILYIIYICYYNTHNAYYNSRCILYTVPYTYIYAKPPPSMRSARSRDYTGPSTENTPSRAFGAPRQPKERDRTV